MGKSKVPVKSLLVNMKEDVFEIGKPRIFRYEFQVRAVMKLAANLPALITAAGADPNKLDPKLFEKFGAFRANLADYAAEGMQGLLISEVQGEMNAAPLPESSKEILHKSAAAMRAAAVDGLAIFDKYVPSAFEQLRYRMRFDPMREPETFYIEPGKQVDDVIAKAWFGSAQAKASHVRDWNRYVHEWPELDKVYDDDAATVKVPIKQIGINKFWSHPKIIALFAGRRDLPNLGLWYGVMPTSNVASERNFGRMRACEGPQKHSITAETLREELLSKCNPELTEEVLEESLVALKKK